MTRLRNLGRPTFLFLVAIALSFLIYTNTFNPMIQTSDLANSLGFIQNRIAKMDTSSSVLESKCDPVHKLAFAKTHKTGSSTLQNILFRFGDNYDLNFALPERSWMFSLKETWNSSMVEKLPAASLGPYDIFAFHSIWNYDEVKKILPKAKYITLLRDPVNCYESNYVYMGLQNAFKMDINEYAHLKAYHNPVRRSHAFIGKDQLLWDLGVHWRDLENQTVVEKKIAEVDKQFDFVMLAEYFDESLVMLADLMCWKLSDVRYLKQNARKKEGKIEIKPDSREILSAWLSADYRLYNHFKKKFDEAMDRYGRDRLKKDVATLRKMNDDITKECVLDVGDNSKLKGEFRMALDIVEGYVMNTTIPWCSSYARSEPNYSVLIRKKQMIKVGLKLGSNKFSTLTKGERKKILEMLRKKVKVKTTGR